MNASGTITMSMTELDRLKTQHPLYAVTRGMRPIIQGV